MCFQNIQTISNFLFLSQTSFSGVLSIYASFCLVALLIGEDLGKTFWQFIG